jgi:hypothetical protein
MPLFLFSLKETLLFFLFPPALVHHRFTHRFCGRTKSKVFLAWADRVFRKVRRLFE